MIARMSLRLAVLTLVFAPLALACRAASPPAEPVATTAGEDALSEAVSEAVAELVAEANAVADAINEMLDDWHQAASKADGARYFGHMAEDAVFLGTDATERWTLAEFRAYCEPYFSKGVGWTYERRMRHVQVRDDVAWFDERLWNDKYGECRGTGVVRRDAGEWKLVHYSLTMPIPNELAADVVKMIRGG